MGKAFTMQTRGSKFGSQYIHSSFGEWEPETKVSKEADGSDNLGSAVENRNPDSNKVKKFRMTPGCPWTFMCALACVYLHSHTLRTYIHVLKLSSGHETAQSVEALAVPSDESAIPGMDITQGENQHLQVVLCPPLSTALRYFLDC